jgi:hypothetical protein
MKAAVTEQQQKKLGFYGLVRIRNFVRFFLGGETKDNGVTYVTKYTKHITKREDTHTYKNLLGGGGGDKSSLLFLPGI